MLHHAFSRQRFLQLLAAGLMLGSTLPRTALAAGSAGTVARVKGTVSLRRGGQQSTVSEGDAVEVGDVVTTLAESRLRIALADGSVINLGELTRLTIAEFAFARETLTREALLDLDSGLLQAITAKAGSGSSFVVRTGNAVAATRSTDWIVEAKKAETTVVVQEGKVDVMESALGFRSLPSAGEDKALLLSAGQSTTIGKIALGGQLGPQMADGAKLEKYLAGLAMD
ncbi:MAG: FecR domain-containing protein [Rhodospirillaceae bacterium]|nr:FecR domain-containing protein [Rhodospirillaceae bacterium]